MDNLLMELNANTENKKITLHLKSDIYYLLILGCIVIKTVTQTKIAVRVCRLQALATPDSKSTRIIAVF
jgi:hypothetical protein